MTIQRRILLAALCAVLILLCGPFSSPAADTLDWSGHAKLRAAASYPDERTRFSLLGLDPLHDGSAEFRLNTAWYLSDTLSLTTHYETVFAGGDTRRKDAALVAALPGGGLFSVAGPPDDDSRFMDLTMVMDEEENRVWYQRLDRLALSWTPDWGRATLGRQAETWGNGLVFNPMDLVNPFSPTDIERDYKLGEDMLSLQTWMGAAGSVNVLAAPRRDPETGDVRMDRSSVAGKLHFARGTTEFDLLLARHYGDTVAGAGARGYLGNAAWRADAVWTVLHEPDGRTPGGFVALTANIDYSWVWWGKNWYGFAEYYHNSLPRGGYGGAALDPAVRDRVARGELFTLGNHYLATHLNVELHPLLNLYLTAITNLEDPSALLQPRAVWSATQDLEVILGADAGMGADGTEFGGFTIPGPIPGTSIPTAPVDRVYCWLSWYF